MMDQLSHDIETAPQLFHWTEPTSRQEIELAVRQMEVVIPDALVCLWEQYGTLDMFESETILNPTESGYDNLAEVNTTLWEQGLQRQYLVFHTGLWLTAIRQSDGAIVELREGKFTEGATYASLDEWYERGIRPMYRERYGLPPANQ